MTITRPRKIPKNEQRLLRMLEMAEILFAKYGYRGVSVEMLARESGMSKATVYAYFHDKEDIFRQTAEYVGGRIREAVDGAAVLDASAGDKIISILQAKDTMVYEIVRSSPHANELLAARDALVKEYFERLNTHIERLLVKLLKQLDKPSMDCPPMRYAKLLIQVSRGLTQGAATAKQLNRDIEMIIGKLLDR